MKLTVFLLLQAMPAWLRLSRADRDAIAEPALAAAFGRDGLSLRHFDAEAFHARFSDVAMIEADSADSYYFAIERLRDTPLIAQGYFTLAEVIPAFENGFRDFAAQDDAA